MRVCIIAEGSYPYVTGGVSSWIQMLVNNMPEHTFVIYAIGAQEKDKGKFRYKLPENIVEVKEVFLDSVLDQKGKYGKRFKMREKERYSIKRLLLNEATDWKEVLSFIGSKRVASIPDFFMSKDFFDILKEIYIEKYSQVPFTEFFWAMRSMLLPLFYIMTQDVPEADLYHSVSAGYAGIVGSMAFLRFNKPFLMTEHGIYTREREEEIIKSTWVKGYFKDMWIDFFYNLSRCAYMCADRVVTLFGKNRDIEVEIGCSKDKITIIPNGIDVGKFRDVLGKSKDDGYINIGAVVRVVPIKDIKTMIQSFAIVKEEVENARFFIMGPIEEDKEYFEECKQLVDLLQVKDVIFTGNVNIMEYIGKMDIMVLTSISEGQPLAVLEGMACSKPFVTTDVGNCRELIYGNDDGYGQAGIVVSVMDYEKIGKAIVSLCKDEELRVEMGKNGYKRVSTLFTFEGFIKAYKELYKTYERVN